MKRTLAMLALIFAPSLALAAAPAKTLNGQLAQDVRATPAAKGIKINARAFKTDFVNGAKGGFMVEGYKAGEPGLPPTLYEISGDFDKTSGVAKIDPNTMKIAPAAIQPRVNIAK